jgi:hypothetical protein
MSHNTPGGYLVKFRNAIALFVVLTASLAACGGDDSTAKATNAPTTPSTATPTLPPTTTTTSPPSPYKATVTPTTGLTDGQEVTVTVSKFKAGLTLGLNECAQKGDGEVGAADCALDHLATLKVGADGTGTGTTKVYASNIGGNKHDCAEPTTRCFISVGELTDDPAAQRADDVDLKFGA